VAFGLGLLVLVAGISSPVWGRAILKRIDYFSVRQVEVVGARWAAPDAILDRASISSNRSVWDDYSDVERRLSRHPLVEEAQVHRSGLHGLRIVIREVEPVALVGTPELRVVRADGTVLPIDPVGQSLNLPVVVQRADLAEDSTEIVAGPALEALGIFARVRELDPGLAEVISDFGLVNGSGLMTSLEASQPASRLALPSAVDETLLRRIRATLGDLRNRGIKAELVEARFANQIVVRRENS
jgi:hypothetical protein